MEVPDSETVVIALAALIGLWLLFVIAVPLVVRVAFRKPIESGFKRIDLSLDGLPEEAVGFFEAGEKSLLAMNFHYEYHLKFDLEADLMDAYGAVFSQSSNRDLALVLFATAPVKLRQIEFSTEFEDGTEINTNNGPQLPMDVVMKSDKRIYWLPGVEVPAELYEAHLALCRAHEKQKRAVPHGAASLEYIKAGVQKDFDHAVRAGIFTFDGRAGEYRLSLRGAYRLTLPNLFPLNSILKVRRRAKDARAVASAKGR